MFLQTYAHVPHIASNVYTRKEFESKLKTTVYAPVNNKNKRSVVVNEIQNTKKLKTCYLNDTKRHFNQVQTLELMKNVKFRNRRNRLDQSFY